MSADGSLSAGEQAIPIESGEVERKEAARDGTRLFALFLDEYHVSPGDPQSASARCSPNSSNAVSARETSC